MQCGETIIMTTSDIILIGNTLALSFVALFVPYLSEKLKRSYFAPKLKINFSLEPPDCHVTQSKGRDEHGNILFDEPDFYFRFRVENTGKSQARKCEAVIEGLLFQNSSGKYTRLSQFTPVNLVWGSGNSTEFTDINPGRSIPCDLCHIPSIVLQNKYEGIGKYVDSAENNNSALGVVLCQKIALHSQPNRLFQGRYRVEVSIYSENAKKIEKVFQISWSGNWKDRELEMFREILVESIR